jgi:hypothetical protein
MTVDPRLSARLTELASEIESIAATLDEISFDVLREASAARTGRPEIDKILTQARRALEKARHLLTEAS